MKRAKKRRLSILATVLARVAPRIGAKIHFEPEWGIVGQIEYKSGVKRYFRYSTIDINTVGACDIARDKDYAKFFMEKMGYPVIEGDEFHSKSWAKAIGSKKGIDAAYRYALKIGFPVIVKPNSRSQGIGVTKVFNKTEFYKAMRQAFQADKVVVVEKAVTGKDYRLVVLDDEVISAYERIPLSVTGDGRSTILGLLKKKQKEFERLNRDTKIKFDDPRMVMKLKHNGMTFTTVLKKGEKIFLLDNANLSGGGDSLDVTDVVHPAFRKFAIKLTKDMGLRLCGVDLMVMEGTIEDKPTSYAVIEINAAPGLDHYASIGRKQEKIVEDLYMKVLIAMEK